MFAIVITVIFISFPNAHSCDYNIIWDRDFCSTTDQGRLENSTLPPNVLEPVCEFEIGSDVTLRHVNTKLYENLFRVNDENDFKECSATNSSSDLILINSNYSFKLDIANFTIGERIYFISTSNGSKFSAENQKQTNETCLQFAFKVVQMRNSCNNKCNSTIFDNVSSDNFGCPSTMDLLILIYIGVPLLILILAGCSLAAFACCQNSTRRLLLQRSMNQQEVTSTTVV